MALFYSFLKSTIFLTHHYIKVNTFLIIFPIKTIHPIFPFLEVSSLYPALAKLEAAHFDNIVYI